MYSTTPVLVALPTGTVATQVSSGASHGVALTTDGEIYAWGVGTDGQLGVGPTTGPRNSTLLLVPTPEGADPNFAYTDVAAGVSHTLATGNDGKTYAWGRGQFG